MTGPIALTCGEPAGIGPEIAAKAWKNLKGAVPFFWIGDPDHLPAGTDHTPITDPQEALDATSLPVLAHRFDGPQKLGTPQARHARDVIKVIRLSTQMVREGRASALCTGPIHKAALQTGAGFAFPGHTEFLAELCEVPEPVMMLAGPDLRVVPATIHIPLSAVATQLTPQSLRQTIEVTHKALIEQFGLSQPRIMVAGLNPHAGEDGRMGREELDMISPLMAAMRKEGYDITGPCSADTMFHKTARDTYDVAICMYHDQALIPLKTLAFDEGVNITLGLDIIRTSPDHGTALDIAGQDRANPSSLIAALKLAHDMARG